MSSPLAFINGRWIARDELTISIFDAGFILGATVTEQLRTFHGALFRRDRHLDRLERSLRIARIDPGYSRAELADIAERLCAENHPLTAAGDDLGVGLFVTPGTYRSFAGEVPSRPTVCAYTYPLPFRLWADKYRRGQAVVVSDVVQVPRAAWPAELKCRSRMHYYLADQRARDVDPGARAILLDAQGHVCETSTANIVLFRAQEGLVSPPAGAILPGISLATLAELAGQLDMPFTQRDILPEELATADELLLTSTPVSILPVTRCNGQPIGTGAPGPTFRRLLAAWSDLVGVDIEAQAIRHAQ